MFSLPCGPGKQVALPFGPGKQVSINVINNSKRDISSPTEGSPATTVGICGASACERKDKPCRQTRPFDRELCSLKPRGSNQILTQDCKKRKIHSDDKENIHDSLLQKKESDKIEATKSFIKLYKVIIYKFKQFDKYTIHLLLNVDKKFTNHYQILYNVTVLDLSNLKEIINIKLVNFNFLVLCHQLHTLNISHNNLVRAPILKSTTIHTLILSHNIIRTINFDCVFYSCQPKIIDLSYNKISKFVCSNVDFIKINLDGNPISPP